MPIEKEIKLAVETVDQWNQLGEVTSIGSFCLSPGKRVKMIDSYADTEDTVIESAGYAFRIREVEGRFIAGLKRQDPADDGRHFRDEIEQFVRGPFGQPAEWPDGEVRSLLANLVGVRPLHVHTRLEMVKIKRDVRMNDASIGEWSLDEIRIPERDPSFVLRELEVELRPGVSSAVLDEIDHELAGLGLSRLNVSKLERIREHLRGSRERT